MKKIWIAALSVCVMAACGQREKSEQAAEAPAEVNETAAVACGKALGLTPDSLVLEVENGGGILRASVRGCKLMGTLQQGDSYIAVTRAEGTQVVSLLNETELNRFIPKEDYMPLTDFRIVRYDDEGMEDTLTVTRLSADGLSAVGKNGEVHLP